MAIYPSKEWVMEVLKAAEESKVYKEAARDWEGDFLCKIEADEEFIRDMGRKEAVAGYISFLGMMTAQERVKYRGTPMGDVLEKKLGIPLDAAMDDLDVSEISSRMSKLSAEDMKGSAAYLWIDFWHGTIRNMLPVAPGEHGDAAFKLSGRYGNWKLLVSGQQDAVKLTMTRKLKLEGDLAYLMRRVRAAAALSKAVFAAVPID